MAKLKINVDKIATISAVRTGILFLFSAIIYYLSNVIIPATGENDVATRLGAVLLVLKFIDKRLRVSGTREKGLTLLK